MPDDDSFTLRSGTGYPDPGTATESDAPPPDSESDSPREAGQKPEDPEQKGRPGQEVLDETRRKAYFEQLEKNYYDSYSQGEKMLAGIRGELQNLMSLAGKPPPEAPVPTPLPAPPSEQQKGGLSEFIFNLLKVGALTAIAYGTSGRGYGHNAIFKSAIGAALTGYAAGRKDVVDRSLQLWEKNREVINDANKAQNQRYQDILKNEKLDLQQKLDLVKQVAAYAGDYRTWQAANQKNLMDLQKTLDDQDKVRREGEKTIRAQRDKLYNPLGRPDQTAKYWAWVNSQRPGQAPINPNSSIEDIEKAEKDYPVSDFLKYQEEEDKKKASEKATAVQKAKQEEKQQPPADPNAPLSEQQAEEMRNKIFGAGTD